MSKPKKCSCCEQESDTLRACAGTCGGREHYCSRKCQIEHWNKCHRAECKKIDLPHALKILAMLAQCPEVINVASEKEVTIIFQDQTEHFSFNSNEATYEFAKQYTTLAAEVNRTPTNGLDALEQLRLVTAFKNRWGWNKVPRRAKDRCVHILALLRCSTY